jgi:putative membrane protein
MRSGGGLLYAWGVNAVALWLASRLFGGVHVHGLREFLIAGAILGVANAILKPVLTILTLPLVIVSLGFFLLLINIAMLELAVWITPHASIHGFWTYAGTVVVIWLVNVAGSSLAARLPPPRRSWPW